MQTPPTARARPASDPARSDRSVRTCLLVSLACLVVQVAVTEYDGGLAQAGLWLALGVLLLWFVWRYRSRVARWVVVISSGFGAVVWALASGGRGLGAVIALLFAGQAVPLLLRPVKAYVRRG